MYIIDYQLITIIHNYKLLYFLTSRGQNQGDFSLSKEEKIVFWTTKKESYSDHQR